MARQASFRIAAVADLFRQLKIVSSSVRTRAMHEAEQLIGDIDPGRNYPLDFIVYRITGYRAPGTAESTTLVGEVLLGDLATLVQRLSATLHMPADAQGRQALLLDDVAARLNVSLKTVQRYRRLGLVCHHVEYDGSERLICFADALERFVATGRAPIRRASRFTRIEPETRRDIIDEARRLQAEHRMTMNEAAAQIARAHGRAHETIRGLLRRHDRQAESPIFDERGPLTEREHRMILRAHDRGIGASELAEYLGRSRKTIHRTVLQMRAARLRAFTIEYVQLPTFSLDDAEQILLSPPSVRTHLDQPQVHRDAIQLLADCRVWLNLPQRDEDALLGAYHFLKQRCAASIDRLPGTPTAAVLDAIETDLRWAARVKRKLVAHGFAVAIVSIEQNLHRPLAEAPRESIVAMIDLAGEVVRSAVEKVNPLKDQHVAKVCRYAMERRLAAAHVRSGDQRAAARHDAGSVLVDDPFTVVCCWQQALDAPPRWKALADAVLDEPAHSVMVRHYGWQGDPPQTCRAIAAHLQTTVAAVTRRLHDARALLRRAALQPDQSSSALHNENEHG